MPKQTADYDPLMDELPPELAAEYRAEQRKRKMAEAMLGQSMQPLQAPQVKGRFQGAISPLAGIAQIAQAYMANKGLEGSDAAMAGLGGRISEGRNAAVQKMTQAMAGTPATPDSTVPMAVGGNPDEQAGDRFQAGAVAVPGSVDAGISAGMGSPYTQKIAQAMLMEKMKSQPLMAFKAEEAKLMREQRMKELEMRLEDQRLSRTDRDVLQRDLAQMRIDSSKDMARMAAGLRQPVAPTMTEIMDPKNPKQLLRVDAKTYRGGSLGDAGVLGVSGKEPTGAAKENKVENGKMQLAETLDQIQTSYDELQRLKAIPSQERGALSNIVSSIATSGIGQMAGRAVSTKEQAERDVIKASRLALLNALKQATGKSAQELNSNVELKTNLDALSDPSQGYEAATRIMDNIRKTYIDGKGGRDTGGKDVRSEADKILGL